MIREDSTGLAALPPVAAALEALRNIIPILDDIRERDDAIAALAQFAEPEPEREQERGEDDE